MIPGFQKKQKQSSMGKASSDKRFDPNGADISDGEFKDIRK
jgi:hypothetical protein